MTLDEQKNNIKQILNKKFLNYKFKENTNQKSVLYYVVDKNRDEVFKELETYFKSSEFKKYNIPLFKLENKKISYTSEGKYFDNGTFKIILKPKRGAGLNAEFVEINSLNKQLNDIKEKENCFVIKIKLLNKIYEVSDVAKTKGTPKSDFHFHNEKHQPVIHISHKKGSSAKHFQQYGGISELLDNKTVKYFVKKVKSFLDFKNFKEYPENSDNRCWMRITDNNLIKKSIYGINWNTSNFNENNVQIICQGNIRLEKQNDIYIIKANHIIENPKIPEGDYYPYLVARRGDRNDAGISKCRICIYPKAYSGVGNQNEIK